MVPLALQALPVLLVLQGPPVLPDPVVPQAALACPALPVPPGLPV